MITNLSMKNEHILLWLAEWGKEWVPVDILHQTFWAHGFIWSNAANENLIEIDDDISRYRYRLTDKAIQQLTKET